MPTLDDCINFLYEPGFITGSIGVPPAVPTISQTYQIAGLFTGASTLSAFASIIGTANAWSGEATFQGVGDLSAAYSGAARQIEATFAGAGTLTVSSAWTPAILGTTVKLWFDLSQSSTVTESAGAISQVNDKSGNNFHITQATGSRKPTYLTASQNGLNTASFDGGDNMSKTSGLGGTVPGNDQTMLVVAKCTGTSAGNLYWTTNGATVAGVHVRGDGVARMQGNSNNFANYDPTNDTWFVHTGYITTVLREIFEDGTSKNSNVVVESAATAPTQIWFGSDSNPVNFYIGELGEFIICSGQLSVSDRQKLEGYAAHKWGLTAGLPGGHPYKTTPPG
jgi:hypothetical protein